MLKIILVLFPALTSLLQLGLEHEWRDRRTKINRRIRRGVHVLIIVTAVLSSYMIVIDDADTRQKELLAQRQIADLKDDVENWNTGGESYPVLMLWPKPYEDGVTEIMLLVRGKHDMKHLNVELVNLDDLKILSERMSCEDPENKSLLEGMKLVDQRRIKVLRDSWMANSMGPIAEVRSANPGSIRLNGFVFAANGQFTMQYRVLRRNGRQYTASQTTKQIGETVKVLHEEIDPDFPKDLEGKIDWNTE